MSPPHQQLVKRLSPNSIREMFNKSQYPKMIEDGRLVADQPYLRDDHLKEPQKRKEPWCTRAQTIRYRDRAGQWAVVIFQYLRPDNTIGGSGRPDPKRLRIGNRVFIVET